MHHIIGDGGECLRSAPCTHAVAAAAVGAHLHRVNRVRRETRKRVGVRGHGDGVGLVTVDTNLPFGGCVVLRPLQCCGSLRDIGDGEVCGGEACRERGERLHTGPWAVIQRAAESAHTGIVGGFRGEAVEHGSIDARKVLCGIHGEVGGGAVLVFPLVGVVGDTPVQHGGSLVNVKDGKVIRLLTRNRREAQLDLVLLVQYVTSIFTRVVGIIVRFVVIPVDSLAWRIKHPEITTACPGSRIVIDNEDEVVGAVVGERGGKLDGDPTVLLENHISAEHEVGCSYGYPVGATREVCLVGVEHVDINVTGGRTIRRGVVEGHMVDVTCLSDFRRRVNLLCERVVI